MAAKLAGLHVPTHRAKVPGVGRVVDGECAVILVRAQQAHAGRAADALASLPDRAPVDDRWLRRRAGGCERCAGNGARGVHARREHVCAVHVVAQQLVAAQASRPAGSLFRGRFPNGFYST